MSQTETRVFLRGLRAVATGFFRTTRALRAGLRIVFFSRWLLIEAFAAFEIFPKRILAKLFPSVRRFKVAAIRIFWISCSFVMTSDFARGGPSLLWRRSPAGADPRDQFLAKAGISFTRPPWGRRAIAEPAEAPTECPDLFFSTFQVPEKGDRTRDLKFGWTQSNDRGSLPGT